MSDETQAQRIASLENGGSRKILLPEAETFAELLDYLGEWEYGETQEEPRMVGANEIGPLATLDLRQIGGGRRTIAVKATDPVLEAVRDRIVTEDDHLSFKLIGHRDSGRVLVVLEHGYIIGSHWLAYIDPETIPPAA